MSTMNSIAEVINNQKDTNSQLPIGKNVLTPIGNRQLEDNKNGKLRNFHTVDLLLEDYSDLIDPNYVHWFAKQLYYIPMDAIHRASSEARQDGKDSKRLFAFLIKKLSVNYHA